jgi:hypothetical protein
LDCFCHRYAPKPLVITKAKPTTDDLIPMTVWPFVHSHDWCGEWKAHPEMPE